MLIALGVAIWLLSIEQPASKDQPPPKTFSEKDPLSKDFMEARPASSEKFFGEGILEGYGFGKPENDLRKMHALVQNHRLLAKGLDARHFAANADVAATFRGENKIALQALPKDHRVFNSEGLLVDRWSTPLFIHLQSADTVGIYSAGPDKILGTEDDYSMESGIVRQKAAEF